MALYAFDGTGNEDRPGEDLDSNVLKFFHAYEHEPKNHDPKAATGSLYLKGIGTRAERTLFEKFAEAFGIGGHRRVRQAMKRLRRNVAAGDEVIDVIGFSRGAALAVDFANTVEQKLPHLRVRFLGLWDTVAQFGLPGTELQAGHDMDRPGNVDHLYHAMSMDETRLFFPLTRMTGKNETVPQHVVEVWFRGVHSDVGGGNGNLGLNWIALEWMYTVALRHELPLSAALVQDNRQHSTLERVVGEHKLDAEKERKFRSEDLLHVSVELTPADGHINPAAELRRVDDAGTVT